MFFYPEHTGTKNFFRQKDKHTYAAGASIFLQEALTLEYYEREIERAPNLSPSRLLCSANFKVL